MTRHALGTLVVGLLAAMAVACYGRNDVTAPDDLLAVTASPAAIPADGISTSVIAVTVSPRADRDLSITFKASAGTIAGSPFHPDPNGRIATSLKSTTVPGVVLVTVDIARGDVVEASRTVTVTFEPVDTSRLIRLVLSGLELEADGASSLQVRAEANPAISPRQVTFQTTNGSFSPTSEVRIVQNAETGADGVARTLLYAPRQVGTALVTATAGGFSASETVTFVPARPDGLTLEAAPLALVRSETAFTTLVAAASRAVGNVTEGTRVEFSVRHDDSQQSFGRFQNVRRTGSNGEASAQFVAGETAPLGLATITARVPDTTVAATIKIRIVP